MSQTKTISLDLVIIYMYSITCVVLKIIFQEVLRLSLGESTLTIAGENVLFYLRVGDEFQHLWHHINGFDTKVHQKMSLKFNS